MPLKQTTLSRLWSAPPREQPASPPPPPAGTPARPPADDAADAMQDEVMPASASAQIQNSPSATAPSATWSSPVVLPAAAIIEPLTTANLLGFRRLVKTLLPVRYPDKTFAELAANPHGTTLARVVTWRPPGAPAGACSSMATRGTVVAAICARLQPRLSDGTNPTPTGHIELYVQMLGVLAPYRGYGLATALLAEVVQAACNSENRAETVLAHVWEANDEALAWYDRRGFIVREGVVENYYQRLEPRGARLVSKTIVHTGTTG